MTTVMGAKELQGLLRVWSDTTPTVLIPHVQDEATEPVTIDEAVSAAHLAQMRWPNIRSGERDEIPWPVRLGVGRRDNFRREFGSREHGIYDMNIAHRVYDGPVVAYCAECRHISRTDVTL